MADSGSMDSDKVKVAIRVRPFNRRGKLLLLLFIIAHTTTFVRLSTTPCHLLIGSHLHRRSLQSRVTLLLVSPTTDEIVLRMVLMYMYKLRHSFPIVLPDQQLLAEQTET